MKQIADTQSRKWQLTINNPADKGLDHEHLKLALNKFKGLAFYCMADEVGLETQTPHTHIFMVLRSPAMFSTVKNRFPDAHIEAARGSIIENRDYVAKSGKWENDPKSDTRVEGSFEASAEEPPAEPGQGARTDIAEIYRKIEDGMSNAEIMAANPDTAMHIGKMDKIRHEILEARYREQWRDLDVTYIFGPTATQKTRSVMDKHRYINVYRVATDYAHPFDRYSQEPVLLLDEFRSSLPVGDMLDYLDGYPVSLPARYANRVACYETVYIISNIDLSAQYPNVQQTEPETWRAFLRRIHHVVEHRTDGPPIDHGSAIDYIFPHEPPAPEWVKEAEQDELPL